MILAALPKSSPPPMISSLQRQRPQKNHSGDISHPVEHLQKSTSDYIK